MTTQNSELIDSIVDVFRPLIADLPSEYQAHLLSQCRHELKPIVSTHIRKDDVVGAIGKPKDQSIYSLEWQKYYAEGWNDHGQEIRQKLGLEGDKDAKLG